MRWLEVSCQARDHRQASAPETINFLKGSTRRQQQFSPLAQNDDGPESSQPAGKKKTVHKKPSATVPDLKNKKTPQSKIITPVIDRTILSSNTDKRTDLDPPTDMETENQEDSDTSRSSFSSSASPVIPNQSFQLYQPPTAHLQPSLSLPPSSRPPLALSQPLISPTVPLPPPPLLATCSKPSMPLAGLPSSSVSVATNFHTAPTTSTAAFFVTEPTSQSSNYLLALRKAYKSSKSALVSVSSHLQFIEACSQQGKTPKGLTVNVRCSAYLADYSNSRLSSRRRKAERSPPASGILSSISTGKYWNVRSKSTGLHSNLTPPLL